MRRRPPSPTLFPYTTLFRSDVHGPRHREGAVLSIDVHRFCGPPADRKSTRLNSSHQINSYAVFCLKKKMLVRPRGWHLPEKHVLVDGEPISASLFDFGLYLF